MNDVLGNSASISAPIFSSAAMSVFGQVKAKLP